MTKSNKTPTDECQHKTIEWISKKSLNKGCEICGHNQWTVPNDTVTPIVLRNNSFQLGGTSYPLVMIICNNCGNTKFINAVMAGIVTAATKEERDDAK